MRRAVIAVLLIVAVFLVAVAGADGFKESTRHPPLGLMDVTKDGRGLRVSYVGGGCEREATATRAVETPTSVSIEVDQPVSTPEGPNEACTADLRIYSVVVPLVNPIAGRRVVGQARGSRAANPAFALFEARGQDFVEIVPRAIGLAPGDAQRMLRGRGYRVRVLRVGGCAKRAQVVLQSPRAHTDRGRARKIQLGVRRACGG